MEKAVRTLSDEERMDQIEECVTCSYAWMSMRGVTGMPLGTNDRTNPL